MRVCDHVFVQGKWLVYQEFSNLVCLLAYGLWPPYTCTYCHLVFIRGLVSTNQCSLSPFICET